MLRNCQNFMQTYTFGHTYPIAHIQVIISFRSFFVKMQNYSAKISTFCTNIFYHICAAFCLLYGNSHKIPCAFTAFWGNTAK